MTRHTSHERRLIEEYEGNDDLLRQALAEYKLVSLETVLRLCKQEKDRK